VSGGGIYNANAATMTIANCTFSDNAASSGDDIYNRNPPTMSIKSTILADNSGGDGFGIIADAGYNIADDSTCGFSAIGSLSNTDPMLDRAGLANNGGPTRTIALLSGSPVIDLIPVAKCNDQASPPNPIITAQRYFPRPRQERLKSQWGIAGTFSSVEECQRATDRLQPSPTQPYRQMSEQRLLAVERPSASRLKTCK
jgi:hypothetical protein